MPDLAPLNDNAQRRLVFQAQRVPCQKQRALLLPSGPRKQEESQPSLQAQALLLLPGPPIHDLTDLKMLALPQNTA